MSTIWDHDAFRDYVLSAARNAGHTVERTADLARVAELNPSLLSKWFRGVEQPSVDRLRDLARVIKAPLTDLLVVAGRSDARELNLAAEPAPPPALHTATAREVDRVLTDTGIPADVRNTVEALIAAVVEAHTGKYRRRRA